MAERQFKSAVEKSEVFLRLRLRARWSGFLRRTSGVKQDTGRETPSCQVDSLIPVTLNYVGNLHCSMQSQAERASHVLKRKPAKDFFFPFLVEIQIRVVAYVCKSRCFT